VGNAVALAFAREGHTTFGLVRNPAKAGDLAKNEVIPVTGEIGENMAQLEKLFQPSNILSRVSIIVDASQSQETSPTSHTKNVLRLVEKASAATGIRTTFIYTSGVWVHGHNPGVISNESSKLNPPEIVSGRPEFEQMVVNHPSLNGIVIRPAMVYGRSGSIFSFRVYGAIERGPKVKIVGNPSTRWAVVHVDDLASAYVAAAERASIVKGEIFDIANTAAESVIDIVASAACVLGVALEPEYTDPSCPFDIALTLSCPLSNRKAYTLLNWVQKHPGIVDGAPRYVQAYKASKQ